VLALAFIVLVGVVTTALLSSLTSAVQQGSALDNVRGRQYAADAAVDRDIARVRALPGNGAGLVDCGAPQSYALNGVTIHVDCTPVPRSVGPYLQRNVVFNTCLSTDVVGTTCPVAKSIVRAQVNYEATTISNPTITKTYVQSWTVTR